MIGRYANLGAYRQLVGSGEFLRALGGGALALTGFVVGQHPGPWARWTALGLIWASIAINGAPIIWGALQGLWERRVNVDELVSLAIVACLIQGEYLSAAVVSCVMVLGSLIEQATGDSARKAIQSLLDLSPHTALVWADGQFQARPVEQVAVGDRLLLRPGDRLAVDAVVKKGASAVDESSMTGEPIPRDKAPGDAVFAGTLNLNGVLEVEATRVGQDSTLGRVIKLVSQAEAHKPKAVRLIDRYSRWFTPLILACAGAAWAITGEANRAVTVLIVGCPCALILAAPTAIVATIGRAAKAGVLVKGGQYLEAVATADVVLFDKTGTLTEGKPRVREVIPAAGVDRLEVLRLAACVEQDSSHPLARAVLKAAQYAKIVIDRAEQTCAKIGAGVCGLVQGNLVEVGGACLAGAGAGAPAELSAKLLEIKEQGATPLYVYQDHRPVGLISVADRVRPAAKGAVEALKALGVGQVGLLSGDHQRSADMVAEAVGLSRAWAEMLPEDKLGVIAQMQAQGRRVIFVGDGVNDAPALAAADVGVAMGAAGADVALETADVALMNDDVAKLPFLMRLSRRMIRVIKWNIAFGLAFNAAAVLASAGGYLSPVLGALAHNVGSVLVVLCSASLAFYERPRAMAR